MVIFEDHDCLLTKPEEEVLKSFIDSGLFISLRRKLHSLCVLSKKHPETPRFFKSNSSCRNEQIRHLVRHFHTIHCFSILNLYWEFFMFVVFTTYFIMIPLNATIMLSFEFTSFILIKAVLECMHVIDILKLFFTGYYDGGKSKVILNLSAISKQYVMTYFLFDVISCMHVFLFVIEEVFNIHLEDRLVYELQILNRMKMIRITRWLDQLELFRRYKGYSSCLFKAIRLIMVFMVLILWGFSIYFDVEFYVQEYVYEKHNHNWKNRIYESCFDATLMLLLVNFGKYDIEDIISYLNAFFFLCFGFILQLFLFAQVMQVWNKYAGAENKHQSLEKQFKEYMTYKNLPINLRHRIMTYFQFKFHKHFYKESDINIMISPLLKQELLMHIIRNHIERVEFFRHLPQNILMKVVGQLKSEVFLPGDVIISAGTAGTSMFFIYRGTVAVYTPSGKEVCHLEDGDHFGEIALILSETRVASVVAVTASELFVLKRSDFYMAIDPFPDFKDKLIALATERMNETITEDKE